MDREKEPEQVGDKVGSFLVRSFRCYSIFSRPRVMPKLRTLLYREADSSIGNRKGAVGWFPFVGVSSDLNWRIL